jgi:hypothetical protein
MTPAAIATVALYIGIYGALATALVICGRAIVARAERQEAERSAAATFEADFIPDSAEIAAAQSAADDEVVDAWLDESMALLDDALVNLERLRRAAS